MKKLEQSVPRLAEVASKEVIKKPYHLLTHFIDEIVIPQKLLLPSIRPIFAEQLRQNKNQLEQTRIVWRDADRVQRSLQWSDPAYKAQAEKASTLYYQMNDLEKEIKKLADIIATKKYRTRYAIERADRLRQEFKAFILQFTDLPLGEYDKPLPGMTVAESVEYIFDYFEAEEELAGTPLTVMTLFKLCERYDEHSRPTNLAIQFLDEAERQLKDTNYGLAINKISDELWYGYAKNEGRATNFGADMFKRRSGTLPNEARPLRLLHLALYQPRRMSANVQGYLNGIGEFSTEKMVELIKTSGTIAEQSFDYFPDFFGHLSEEQILDCYFINSRQETYQELRYLYAYLAVGISTEVEEVLTAAGINTLQSPLSIIQQSINHPAVRAEIQNQTAFKAFKAGLEIQQGWQLQPEVEKTLALWVPYFETNPSAYYPYAKLSELAAFLPYESIKQMIKLQISAGYPHHLERLVGNNPDYFVGDTEMEELITTLVQNQVKRGFFVMTMLNDLLAFIRRVRPTGFDDWLVNIIQEALLAPEDEMTRTSMGFFEQLLTLVPESRLLDLGHLLLLKAKSSDFSELNIMKLVKFCHKQGYSSKTIDGVLSLAVYHKIDMAELIKNYYGNAKEKEEREIRIRPHFLSQRSRQLFFCSAISQGSHLLTDPDIQAKIELDPSRYDEDTPIATIFADFVQRSLVMSGIDQYLDNKLIAATEIEHFKANELGQIEPLAMIMATFLLDPFEAHDCSSFTELARKVTVRALGLAPSAAEIFSWVKKKKDREQIYLVARSFYHSGISFELLSPDLITRLFDGFRQTTSYPVNSFFHDLRTAIELEDRPERFLKQLNLVLLEQGKEGDGEGLLRLTKLLLEQRITKNFKKVFTLKTERNVAEEIKELRERWGGNIEPLLLAAARAKADRDQGSALLQNLAQMVDAELKGRFRYYKYSGVGDVDKSKVKNQQRHLSREERKKWRGNPSMLKVVGQTENSQNQFVYQVAHAAQQFTDQAVNQAHLFRAGSSDEKDYFSLNTSQVHRQLKAIDSSSTTAIDEVKRIFKLSNSSQLGLLSAKCLVELSEQLVEQPTLSSLVLKVAKYIKNDLLNHFEQDFQQDISMLIRQLTPPKQDSGVFVVFATMTDSLRILLDIGDVVPAGSCQSLTRGGHTETVQGPPGDSHTKVAIAFKIELHQLSRNPDRVQTILQAIKDDKVATNFDHSSLTLELTDKETGVKLFQTKFDHGIARQIVRVGSVYRNKKNTTKVKAERVYHSQYHPELPTLLDQLIAQIGLPVAKENEGVRIEESRSPGGAYSDMSGGVQKYSYTMNPHGREAYRNASSF